MFRIASRSRGDRAKNRYARLLSLALLLSTIGSGRLTAQNGTPKSGAEVLERMRTAYSGRWYQTLTFVQKTTIRRQDGTDTVQTWYESLRHSAQLGTRLRIDFGNPADGNGVLYTADSSYRLRGGKLASSSGNGNEFLPLIEGVYVQPVERTVRELEPTKVDMARVTTGMWENRSVWIVGATSAADTTSPQFWVDAASNVVVRMILSPVATRPPMDVRLDQYEKAGSGVLATRIEMFIGGARAQAEEYSDWKVDQPLDPALFDAATWSSARHWVKTAGGG